MVHSGAQSLFVERTNDGPTPENAFEGGTQIVTQILLLTELQKPDSSSALLTRADQCQPDGVSLGDWPLPQRS